ncbi:hypothetical protein SAMN05421847_0312 [Halpernia humi]|uniref:Uncharacterized protein n=1 Tax=Halpernia humi TaxID=493375 RepID=A0A1H5T0W1_9FLAO|nr:hypothetical protein SAMN05421847_0312 [Halpernia humi]
MYTLNKVLKIFFVLVFTLNIIVHANTLLDVNKNIFDIEIITSVILIISLIMSNKITSLILFLFILILFYHILIVDGIYSGGGIFIGNNLSSYIRLNITHNLIVNQFISHFSLVVCFFIIFLELPFRWKTQNFDRQ